MYNIVNEVSRGKTPRMPHQKVLLLKSTNARSCKYVHNPNPNFEGGYNPNPSFRRGYNPNLSFRRGYNPNPNFDRGYNPSYNLDSNPHYVT